MFTRPHSARRQAVYCAVVIEDFARQMLGAADLSLDHSTSDALVKAYSAFLIFDSVVFPREQKTVSCCLELLANSLADRRKYSALIVSTVQRYLSEWDAHRLHIGTTGPSIADLPTFVPMVSEDLSKSGYTIDPLVLNQYFLQYQKALPSAGLDPDPQPLFLRLCRFVLSRKSLSILLVSAAALALVSCIVFFTRSSSPATPYGDITLTQAESISVWISMNGGTKYHSIPTCSDMVSPRRVTLAKAQTLGYTPCRRCF